LIGLLFDGTFDSVAADFLFDKAKTRSIHVDTRYMLWVMAEVDQATNLLKRWESHRADGQLLRGEPNGGE